MHNINYLHESTQVEVAWKAPAYRRSKPDGERASAVKIATTMHREQPIHYLLTWTFFFEL